MIQARNLCLAFNDQTIFDHISFTINQDDRVGLVGRNGSGKTTLLKAILDPSVLDEGSVSIQSKKRVAYMPQEVVLQSKLSILEETCTAFAELTSLTTQAQEIEAQLQHNPNDVALVERYAELQEKLAQFSPEQAQAQAKKILMGLGFGAHTFEQPVETLSVGWKMRIVLAKLLLQDADFYLFDEPTNHLDLIAKEWFLDFLKTSDFGFMLICHERYFLDELCSKIVELERGKATWYSGNYSHFEKQKEHNLALLEAAYVQQQKMIKQKEEFVERFRAKASKAKQAQSVARALEKLERIELPPSTKDVSFSFPPVPQAGKVVLEVHNLAFHFGTKQIFSHVSFEIGRGQKVAIVAPNGVGKTTLFNVIAGILPLQQGTITFGHNVAHAIFAQDQNKALNQNLTILENIQQLCPKILEQKIRSFLGSFLFSGDDVQKKVKVLSGGEKNRVGMVSVLLQQANLLLLDEPTNHLDIPSKEILLRALQDFQGTLLFVSHDRDFINHLATHVIELTQTGAHKYEGNFDSFIEQKEYANNAASTQVGLPPTKSSSSKLSPQEQPTPTNREQQKRMQALERKIADLERKIQDIQASFADLEYGTVAFSQATKRLDQLHKELKEAELAWEQSQK